MLDVQGLTRSFIQPWRSSIFANIDQAPWGFFSNLEELLRQQTRAILEPDSIVGRLQLIDQEPED